jgi:LytS/YehU family sensor histidine kinase
VIRTEKKPEALDFVENLSQVYRYILDSETSDTVTISEELAFLRAYAYLLKKRFGDNLKMQITVDKNLEDHRIPPMALQVLIENVVKHNQLSSKHPVTLTIENQGNMLAVMNNVQKKDNAGGHGLGLVNLNKQYKMISGREIEIASNETQFIVKLPILEPMT